METNSHTISNIELTEMWLDGKFDEVAWEITDSKQFMEKDKLIDFCLYFQKYVGEEDLRILQKFIKEDF